jgi:hypothetical protein
MIQCRTSAKTRQRREHDDDLEGRGAAYVSTFRFHRGQVSRVLSLLVCVISAAISFLAAFVHQ